MTASSTLPSLFWKVLGGLEREYANEGAGKSLLPPLEIWANLLRAVYQTGIDRRELPSILRLSKRAVRSRLSTAVRHGWVEELKIGPGDDRVRLTLRGTHVAGRWSTVQRTAEERWRAAVGIHQSANLRACLEDLVAALPLELPHYPASYGPADASITGGNGEDWKGVPRKDGDSVTDLPLSALVSEALVAFAMQYEEKSPVALSLSTEVVCNIPVEGRPLREIGRSSGLSALIRHGFVRVISSGGTETAFLTPRGLEIQLAYEQRINGIETGWREKFSQDLITSLHCVLGEIADSGLSTTSS